MLLARRLVFPYVDKQQFGKAEAILFNGGIIEAFIIEQ